MTDAAYYNGKFGRMSEISVPLTDRALYFGDGVYDAAAAVNGKIFALDEHIDRFFNSCRLLEIKFHMSRDELKDVLNTLADMYDRDKVCMVYWQSSRGCAVRGHSFPEGVKPTLMAFASPLEMTPFDREYDIISLEDKRFYFCNIKTLNLIPSVLGAQREKEADADEVVFHRGSRVTEGAHRNVLIIKDGELVTPPADELILPGITRKHLMELAPSAGLKVKIQPFSLTELMNADEVIISSSSTLCARVRSVDGIPVGGKDEAHIKALQGVYGEKFKEETGYKI
ncbi:MAG: aminotransferase class IV [Clostridiales bacterium]|nr:aminotransferase class IV [Clostridiales bacterium]